MSLPYSNIGVITWQKVLEGTEVTTEEANAISTLDLTKCLSLSRAMLRCEINRIATSVPSEVLFKILNKINETGLHFIVQLEKPLLFVTLDDAESSIEKFKRYGEKNYYNGKFMEICDRCYIFEFQTTFPASKARLDCFNVVVRLRDINDIVPECITVILNINLDTFSISKRDLDNFVVATKEATKEATKDRFFQVIDRLIDDQSLAKRMKLETDNSVPVTMITDESLKVTPEPQLSKLNELAKTTYIVEQLVRFAESHSSLKVCGNQSRIGLNQWSFSKYSKSRPGITAVMTNVSVLSGMDVKIALVMSDTEETDASIDDSQYESKLNSDERLDGLGQLLAGMEKTYADLLYQQLKTEGCELIKGLRSDVVMYGMYMFYDTDECILLKAIFRMGQDTQIERSNKVGIASTLNRVLNQLCQTSAL